MIPDLPRPIVTTRPAQALISSTTSTKVWSRWSMRLRIAAASTSSTRFASAMAGWVVATGMAGSLAHIGRIEIRPTSHVARVSTRALSCGSRQRYMKSHTGTSTPLSALNALHAIDRAIKRCNPLHVGELGQGNQIGLGKIESNDLVDLHRAQQQVVVSRRDGGKGEKRARHPRDFRPGNLIERLQDVQHLGEH